MKNRILLLVIAILHCGCVFASREFRYDSPKLTVSLPEDGLSTGRAVLILPGGGYVGLAVDHEGFDWMPYFNDAGIAVGVLEYSMPDGNASVPMADVERAMAIIKENAAEWNINPEDIGVMGFSAGGHLASTFATHCHSELAPSFQILFYPVITMDERFTHRGSREQLLGANPSERMVEIYSNEKQVTEDTPRALLILADGDDVVPVENSAAYYLALVKKGVNASIHVYPSGGHGFGFSEGFEYHREMLLELSKWMKSF